MCSTWHCCRLAAGAAWCKEGRRCHGEPACAGEGLRKHGHIKTSCYLRYILEEKTTQKWQMFQDVQGILPSGSWDVKKIILEELSKPWWSLCGNGHMEVVMNRGSENWSWWRNLPRLWYFPHFNFLCLLFGIFASILLANCKLMLAQVHRIRCLEVRVGKVTLDK